MYGLSERPWPIGNQPPTRRFVAWRSLPRNPGVEALLLAGGSFVGEDGDAGVGDHVGEHLGDGPLDSVDLASVLAELCCLLPHLSK